MRLHLGGDVLAHGGEIVGIFDMEKSTVSKHTRDYLSRAAKRGTVETVSYEMPKSFVVTVRDGAEKTYISQISSVTLLRRAARQV